MKRRRSLALIVVALGALFLGVYGMSQAAGRTAGSGPADALALPSGWQTLTAGQQTWYAFDYSGDKSEIVAQLSASPAGSAAFAIWSPTDVERWSQGYAVTPTGRGSANANYNDDLIWAGSSSYAGTWYVVVEPAGQAQTWFSVKVSGSGVTRHVTSATTASATPTPAVAQPTDASSAIVAAARTAVALQSTPTAGFQPYTPTPAPKGQNVGYDALPLPDGWQSLGVGQHVWYAFQYAGDKSQIMIQLHAEPQGSAKFTVWSPDVLQRWVEGYFYTPTGSGSASSVYNGDLIWSGKNMIKGTWYVIVEQTGNAATHYTLQVSGTGIDKTLVIPVTPTPTYSPLQAAIDG
jgi:hypothetical protein